MKKRRKKKTKPIKHQPSEPLTKKGMALLRESIPEHQKAIRKETKQLLITLHELIDLVEVFNSVPDDGIDRQLKFRNLHTPHARAGRILTSINVHLMGIGAERTMIENRKNAVQSAKLRKIKNIADGAAVLKAQGSTRKPGSHKSTK